MRRCLLGIGIVWLLLSAPTQAAGTVAVTTSFIGPITKYSFAWTSTAGGAVSGNGFAVRRGYLLMAKFVPGAGGTQPSDLYDVSLVDTDGVDVLSGMAVNRSNATSSILEWDPQHFNDGTQTLDLVVAAAGSAKTGVFILWVVGE